MALDFTVKDVNHEIAAKFAPASLPDAKKPYRLKAVHQPTLDIHGIASKAEVYNVTTSPKVVEEGLTAAMEIIYYLVADGYQITTPLFNLKVRIPGEYDGSEIRLPEGVFPAPRLEANIAFKRYLKDRVHVTFDGVSQGGGIIAEAHDGAAGLVNETATIGGLLTIHGLGLKIKAGAGQEDKAGLFFDDGIGTPVKADMVMVNEPRTLKALVPPGLRSGAAYTLLLRTQLSAKGHGTLLKKTRELRSGFTLTARP